MITVDAPSFSLTLRMNHQFATFLVAFALNYFYVLELLEHLEIFYCPYYWYVSWQKS